MQRRGIGPRVKCKCPTCGYEIPHKPGFPCRSQKCPKCNIPLVGID